MPKLVEVVPTPMSTTGSNDAEVGFTLLETLAVIVVVAVISIGIPTVSALVSDGARLRDAAFLLADDLRALRTNALNSDSPGSLIINAQGNGYVLQPANISRDIPVGALLVFTPSASRLARPDTAAMMFQSDSVTGGGVFKLTMGDLVREVEITWPSGAIAHEH